MKSLSRKILLVFCCLLLLQVNNVLCFAKNDVLELSVSSVTVSKSDKYCSVDIFIDSNPGIAAFDICINSKLKITNIEEKDFAVIYNEEYGLINWSSAVNKKTTGKIATVAFEIPQEPLDEYDVGIIVNAVFDEKMNDVPTTVNSGKVTIQEDISTNIFDRLLKYFDIILAFFASFANQYIY